MTNNSITMLLQTGGMTMCGRYFVDFDALSDVLAEDWGIVYHEAQSHRQGDICPGMTAPALLQDGAGLSVKDMKWGFGRAEGGLVINARVETIATKPMYRGIQQRQRCALPAFHYYEWRGGDRQKFEIGLSTRSMFFLAGLYRIGREGTEFVVLTQPPLKPITPIHDRMPLLLDSPAALRTWLGGREIRFGDEDRLRIAASGPEQLQMKL